MRGATWTGNVPSIHKVGNAWTVNSVIPDLGKYKITDDKGNDVCIQSSYMVGTREGVIDKASIKFSIYTFNTTQTLTIGQKSYQVKNFVFAFHGDENLYSNIKELVISPTLSATNKWTITNVKGKTLALTKVKMSSTNDCMAVYEEGASVAYMDFKKHFLKK
jgi:hypothetical protein